MSQTQKIIKYCATFFAWFLVISIVSGFMLGIASLSGIFSEDESFLGDMKEIPVDKVVEILDVEVVASNIIFKEGSDFSVETDSKYIKIRQKGNILEIEEEEHMWINRSDNSSLVIYVPSDFQFTNVTVEAGAGKVNIGCLSTKRLDLDLGAGKVEIDKLEVLTEMNLDGGAGEITIKDGTINNLEIDMGVGELNLTAKVSGNSSLDAGVGTVNLNLIGTKNDYRFKIDKGIGNASVDGENVSGGTYYGEGSSLLDIDGGVGTIKISFVNTF